jgi:DNA polymerase-3 subunit epsilon/ATP-dependent DNA helicase DinG
MSRTYIALDLEATGMQPERDEIIEIGAVKFREGQVLGRWDSLVRSRQPVPYKITQLTGIRTGDVMRAPGMVEIAPQLSRFVGDSPIIGQSIWLDMAMLERAGLRLRNILWDTFELATLVVPEAPVYNLRSVASALGIRVNNSSHRALADAELTMQVFLALRERIEEMPLELLSDIGKATARSDWPLRHLFSEVEHEKARSAFSPSLGSSIRAQLMSKGHTDAELDVGLLRSPGGYLPDSPPATGYDGKRPIEPDEIRAILEPGGPFSATFEGYEHRPQQIEMAEAVAEAFNEGRHLVVEAGTGTGKSVGYLLPAILYATRTGDPVVVSTSTINLQDQLFSKDLPMLHEVLAHDEGAATSYELRAKGKQPAARGPRPAATQSSFRSSLLKGKANYLCLRRWYNFRRATLQSVEQLRTMVKVLIWLPETQTGDRNELLLLNEENATWRQLCVSEEGCPLYECRIRQKGLCFYDRAKRQAQSAHILVVNHSLLLADLAMGGGVLPNYRHVVIDEAHNLEDEATDALGFTVDRFTMLRLLNTISASVQPDERSEDFLTLLHRAMVAELSRQQSGRSSSRNKISREGVVAVDEQIARIRPNIEKARASAIELFATLIGVMDAYADEQGPSGYDLKQRITTGVRRHPTWSQIELLWDNLGLLLKRIEEGLQSISNKFGDIDWDYVPQDPGEDGANMPQYADLLVELRGLISDLNKVRTDANSAITNPSEGAVYWLEAKVKGGDVSLRCAPLHVGPLLDRHLFSAKRSVILTSATLSTDNSFSYVRERLGLATGKDLPLSSPFDFEKAALLYLPTDMPEPGMAGYQRALEQALIDLCQASEGRALILFTSHSAVRATYRAITKPLDDAGIITLGHNIDGSRKQLLERFRSNPRTVLLGTSSFWEGIDVVGDALSVLVIAKLPFAVPSDPVFAARSESFEDPFNQYSVPYAILKFKQGFGRLIRSRNDRGVVAVLDKRILTKRYGLSFINSLPECTIKRGPVANLPGETAEWLANSR